MSSLRLRRAPRKKKRARQLPGSSMSRSGQAKLSDPGRPSGPEPLRACFPSGTAKLRQGFSVQSSLGQQRAAGAGAVGAAGAAGFFAAFFAAGFLAVAGFFAAAAFLAGAAAFLAGAAFFARRRLLGRCRFLRCRLLGRRCLLRSGLLCRRCLLRSSLLRRCSLLRWPGAAFLAAAFLAGAAFFGAGRLLRGSLLGGAFLAGAFLAGAAFFAVAITISLIKLQKTPRCYGLAARRFIARWSAARLAPCRRLPQYDERGRELGCCWSDACLGSQFLISFMRRTDCRRVPSRVACW